MIMLILWYCAFWCLKWPILTEMTVKYEKYYNFSCEQGRDIPPPPVVLSGGGGPDPPLAETLNGVWGTHAPTSYFRQFLKKGP